MFTGLDRSALFFIKPQVDSPVEFDEIADIFFHVSPGYHSDFFTSFQKVA